MEMMIGISGGSIPTLVRFALVLSLLDVALAVAVSIYQRALSSQLGYRGLSRKLAFALLLLATWLMLIVVKSGEFAFVYANAVAVMVVAYELASIKRHLRKLGISDRYLRWLPDDRDIYKRNESDKEN